MIQLIKAFIVELRNYNGKWVTLPMEDEDLSIEIESLGNVGGDYDVHDTETDIEGINHELSRMSIFQMNDLAKRFAEMESYEIETFEIVMDSVGNIEETFERLENHDYIILHDIDNEEDLGRVFIEEGLSGLDIPAELEFYFDYEAYGRDLTFSGWDIVESNRAAVCLH